MVMRTMLAIKLLVISIWQVHANGSRTLERIKLNKVDPLAICNDGSSATYSWKKSPTGSNKWLIYLSGGGGCWDEESCKVRSVYE